MPSTSPAMTTLLGEDAAGLAELAERIAGLIAAARALEAERAPALARIPAAQQDSARNLLHYLALRRQDIRPLQMRLVRLGLSSLGRLESHVLAGLGAVLAVLRRLQGLHPEVNPEQEIQDTFARGASALPSATTALLGPSRRGVRIMVTLPSSAARDGLLVRRLIDAGMEVARINCSHDDAATWRAMAEQVRMAARDAGASCRILMDLGGPKLRTGALEPGPAVQRVGVGRDAGGQVVAPARIRLGNAAGELPVPMELLTVLADGDVLHLCDHAGRHRWMDLRREADGWWMQGQRTCYIATGTTLVVLRDGEEVIRSHVGELPPQPGHLLLSEGDHVLLTADQAPGRPGRSDGAVQEQARIPCTLPEALAEIRPGQTIAFDDGAISGVAVSASPSAVEVRITRAKPGGAKLRADKGINLPETELSLPALTDADRADLQVAVQIADLVGMSFVRRPADVLVLHEALAQAGADRLGTILKIETAEGFAKLPEILLTAMQRPPMGVMVARGDLGVEIGFERMAEVQEQILWLCEAAQTPVIWATQVLESLNKKGLPTRGEVTDAAMSGRAECVMLNKGPYVVETVQTLDSILRRMQDHHVKKTPMLRRLKVSEGRWELDS